MKILAILGIILGVIVLLVLTSWQLYPGNTSNYFQSPSVTTVIIPNGVEDQASGKNYEPQYIRVIIGINNTVRWTNVGIVSSSVIADNQSDINFFDVTHKQTYLNFQSSSKLPNFLKPGESFEYTFTKSGYFGYHSELHPWQRGWVLVLSSDQSNEQIPEHVNLSASGLYDTYAVGQKIDFTVELSGYGITCPIPDISIKGYNESTIWHASHSPITSCDPERGGFRIQYKLSDGLGVPMINETGSYVVVVSYGNQTMSMPFVVVKSVNDINDLSESLPHYTSSAISPSQISGSIDNDTQIILSVCSNPDITKQGSDVFVICQHPKNSTGNEIFNLPLPTYKRVVCQSMHGCLYSYNYVPQIPDDLLSSKQKQEAIDKVLQDTGLKDRYPDIQLDHFIILASDDKWSADVQFMIPHIMNGYNHCGWYTSTQINLQTFEVSPIGVPIGTQKC